jgi:redox-sensing transcriptional repressor
VAKAEHIPAPAIRRLSLYLRQLEAFHAGDRKTVSSRELGEALGLSDAQVRKDLAYFGQFGHPGIGYRVPELIQRVRRILGTDKKTHVLLVGCGNLGRALMSYRGFNKRGFEVVAVFDSDATKVGSRIGETHTMAIQHLSELRSVVQASNVQVGIICVPAAGAQAVADEMVAAGIRGILNFAPVTLRVDEGVGVASVDLAVHLEQLAFQVSGVLE